MNPALHYTPPLLCFFNYQHSMPFSTVNSHSQKKKFSVRFRLKGGCAVRFSRISVLSTSRVRNLSACFEHGVKAASRSHGATKPLAHETKRKKFYQCESTQRCRVQNSCTLPRSKQLHGLEAPGWGEDV
jgi:hypothetical protein